MEKERKRLHKEQREVGGKEETNVELKAVRKKAENTKNAEKKGNWGRKSSGG